MFEAFHEWNHEGKNNKLGTHEINKICLSRFGDKIYIINNGYDGLALGY